MPRTQEDDFILTISDDDDLPANHESVTSEDDATITASKKRKREDANVTEAKNPKARKIQLNKKPVEPNEDSQGSSSSEVEDINVHDGMIDPDFEFDLGLKSVANTTEDFDGWGDNNKDATAKGSKKGVDIDEIIAIRNAKRKEKALVDRSMNIRQNGELDEVDPESEEGEEENDQDNDMSIVDQDGELLADDTFGGGVSSESDVEEEDDSKSNSDGGEASDDESVASPTVHPDDLASQSDDDDNDTASQTSVSDEEEAARRKAFFAPETDVVQTKSTSSFQQFSLSRPILRALAALGFSTPTPIQTRTIPVALQGLDIVGSAVTGSGKTAAFLLPILERLLYRPRKIPTTRVAILMPTRELAVQCYNVAMALARYTDITFAQVVGGFSLREQEAILKKRPDVVIATPGRFIDHMRNSASFTIENLEILVLDEADRMLEVGFADELDEILRLIPKGRQTMLFSATMTESVDKLVRVGMSRPVRVSVDAKKSTVTGLVQEFVRLRPGRETMRLATLCLLCQNVFTERTIVFFRQKKEAHRVRIIFGLLGIQAGELHGSLTQDQRIQAVDSFRDGKTTHLLATDVASRGLDIKNVMSVVNYEAPQNHEIYLHRVGRTARAGRSGRSCTIAAEPDRKVVKAAVKMGRTQGAKIVSRTMDAEEIDEMHGHIEELEGEVDEILAEEKQEKALASMETQIARGENIVKHEVEIKSRPKRTWFESEKEKQAAKERGKVELNSGGGGGGSTSVKFTGEKKKLSNKDKKRLDDRRERLEGKMWRKKKEDGEAAKAAKRDKTGGKKKKTSAARGGKGGRR